MKPLRIQLSLVVIKWQYLIYIYIHTHTSVFDFSEMNLLLQKIFSFVFPHHHQFSEFRLFVHLILLWQISHSRSLLAQAAFQLNFDFLFLLLIVHIDKNFVETFVVFYKSYTLAKLFSNSLIVFKFSSIILRNKCNTHSYQHSKFKNRKIFFFHMQKWEKSGHFF